MAFRVALIGLGMAVTPHAKSLLDLKDRVEVAYAYSPSRERRAKFAERFPFPQCDRLETILEDRTVEAVLVLTPPNTHLEIVSRCAAAGKHVLLEKPLEISTARAEQLVRKPVADVKLAVVLQHRFRPAAEKLREHAAEDSGEARVGVAAIPNWRPQSYYDQPGRGTRARDGGGVLLTQGIHTLDLFFSLTGEPRRGEELRRPPRRCTGWRPRTWSSPRCASRTARSAWCTPPPTAYPGSPERIELIGTRGTALLEGTSLKMQIRDETAASSEDRSRRRRHRRRSDGVPARLPPRRAGGLPGLDRAQPRAAGERRRGAEGSPLHRQNSSIRRLTRSGASSCGKWPRPGSTSILHLQLISS